MDAESAPTTVNTNGSTQQVNNSRRQREDGGGPLENNFPSSGDVSLSFSLPESPDAHSPYHRFAWEAFPPESAFAAAPAAVDDADPYVTHMAEILRKKLQTFASIGAESSVQASFPLWYRSRVVAAGDPRDLKKVESDAADDEDDDDTLIPCVFTWSSGGHHVSLTGTFTDWKEPIPMHRSGQEYAVIQSLRRGVHLYKFIVNGEWRYCPHQPTRTDGQHNVNNCLDLRSFKPQTFSPPDETQLARNATYTQVVPRSSAYTTDAPMIPVILGKSNCVATDPPARLTAPLHCLANHLYHDGHAAQLFGANITAVTCTQRWKPSTPLNMTGLRFSTITYITFNPLFPSHGDPAFEIQAAAPLRYFLRA